VYDLEIKNPIDSIPGGWNNHAAMGISVLCVYDPQLNQFKFFDDGNFIEFQQYWNGDYRLIGFNNKQFDYPVIAANWDLPPSPIEYHIDLREQIGIAAGVEDLRYTKGKLGEISELNLGLRKTNDGANAPVLYRLGRWAELFDYCMRDVEITRDLAFRVTTGIEIEHPTYGPLQFSEHQKNLFKWNLNS
jgi:DEAD/DEAH box helicase domain-containing protein